MSNNDEIKIRFESSAVFGYDGCNVAYGRLYLNDMHSPALRLCMDIHIIDLPLKVDGDRLLIVEKAPYYIQILPYRYITYTTPLNVLYLISARGAEKVFCNADREICNKLPPMVYINTAEDVYNVLKNALASNETL